MARLILEEGGTQRAFNLHPGRLTIGSGESCSLTLKSPDVAEVHAELKLDAEGLTLIPRPGVTPPKVHGKSITKATRLPEQAEFSIGSAIFRMQAAGAPAEAPRASAAAAKSTKARLTPKSERQPTIEHRRRTIQKGLPTWMVLAILTLIGVVGYFVGTAWLKDRSPEYDPKISYMAALEAYNHRALLKAMDELGHIDPAKSDAKLRAQTAALREKIEEAQHLAEVAAWNIHGTKWMETQLKGYEKKYLKGRDVPRAKVRLFIKRCDEFSAKYPQHPDLGWLKRFRERWMDKAELTQPNDVEDVTWEVHMLTAGKPRDYAAVFKLLEDVQRRSSGSDGDAVTAMFDTQIAERQEYFTDRMLQSRYLWEREEYGEAVEWLVQVITKIGDDTMRNQATDALLKMVNHAGVPLTDLHLGGYQRDRPWQFDALCRDPRIKAAATAAGLL
ncbi:MAG: FHA domain-containing protein [bacterium]|nr:hypothetical protein [Planctomycetota bacterium]HIL53034.1 hypothetical protein [Planctomycetota bacterium]